VASWSKFVKGENEISELKELALAMAKKKLMKLMNLFLTVLSTIHFIQLCLLLQFPLQQCDCPDFGIGGSKPRNTIVQEIHIVAP
jgi:hypothetical protein